MRAARSPILPAAQTQTSRTEHDTVYPDSPAATTPRYVNARGASCARSPCEREVRCPSLPTGHTCWPPACGSRRFAVPVSSPPVSSHRLGRARGRLGPVVGEVVEIGRHRSEEFGRLVRSGTDRPLAGLGLVTTRDLVAFERRMRHAPAAKTAPPKKNATAGRDGVTKSPTASTAKRTR